MKKYFLFFVLAVFGAAAYSSSFSGPFLFDDHSIIITDNYFVQNPAAWWKFIGSKRALVNGTFALNYFLQGEKVEGFHLVNFIIHLLNAFLIFGIVLRTLRIVILRPTLCEGSTKHEAEESRYEVLRPPGLRSERVGDFDQEDCFSIAFAIALLWLVHPLGTQAVTYIVQRQESMMAFFYLAALYGFIRSEDSKHRRWWQMISVIACVLGQMSKEVMVTAPLMVLAYDRMFVSGSFFQALKNKKLFYAGLFATWKIAFSGLPFASSESVGFTIGFTPWEYLRTQPGVLLHYLKLSFWPYPLCFDYVWPVARNFESIFFPMLVIIPVGLAVLWGFWKKTPAAFCGLWFFLILAPTSSIIPLLDLAAEHRMYLPLAGVISFAVMAAYRIVAAVTAPLTRTKQWVFFSVLFILAGILSFATWQRNRDYRSGEIMWKDVIQKRPGNYRASYNLANYYSNHGNNSEAVKYYVHAISLEPRYADAHNNLGWIMHSYGQLELARNRYRAALAANPNHFWALNNLGSSFLEEGDPAQALPYLMKAQAIDPGNEKVIRNLAAARQALADNAGAKPEKTSLVFRNSKE